MQRLQKFKTKTGVYGHAAKLDTATFLALGCNKQASSGAADVVLDYRSV